MMVRKLTWILVILMAAGCVAPKPAQPQAAPTTLPAASAPIATATRLRAARPTETPAAAATATASPTVAPTATVTQPAPTGTATAVPTAVAAPANQAAPGALGASGVVLAIDPRKYPTPIMLAPDSNTTYHVAQPVVHFAWSATPTELMKFGQTSGCISDATNYRRAFESYQLVIHSLDAPQADLVQWTENNPSFDLNLTTVPQGRYAWSVNVVTLCESYIVGRRTATIQRSFLGAASPTSATRIVNWVP